MKLIAALTLGFFAATYDEACAQSNSSSYDAKPFEITPIASDTPLAAENGMTLYTFDNDAKGVTRCYEECVQNWPPYLAIVGDAAPSEGLSKVARRDGTVQWAKNGAPLYFWVGDILPGDITGDGVGGVWHVAE